MSFLEKKNPGGIGWKRRLFILDGPNRILSYYLSPGEAVLGKDLGTIYLPKSVSIYPYPELYSFQIHTNTRKYILKVSLHVNEF